MISITTTQDYNSVAEIISELNALPKHYTESNIEHNSSSGTKHFCYTGETWEQVPETYYRLSTVCDAWLPAPKPSVKTNRKVILHDEKLKPYGIGLF